MPPAFAAASIEASPIAMRPRIEDAVEVPVLLMPGWGEIAIPGPRSFLDVYVAAPILGAVCGGGLYERVLRRLFTPVVQDVPLRNSEPAAPVPAAAEKV